MKTAAFTLWTLPARAKAVGDLEAPGSYYLCCGSRLIGYVSAGHDFTVCSLYNQGGTYEMERRSA